MPDHPLFTVDEIAGSAPEEEPLFSLEEVRGPHVPDLPLQNGLAQQQVDQERQLTVGLNRGRVGNVAVGLSKWDDWRGNLRLYGLQRVAESGEIPPDTTSQEIAESAHRYLTTIGETFDASVLEGERQRDVLKDARKRYLTMMAETGWAQVATPVEAKEVEAAFLFDEVHRRVNRSPERLDLMSDVTYTTLLERQRGLILQQGATPDLTDALATLTAASKQERRDLIVKALRGSEGFYPLPQNEVEEKAFAELSQREFGARKHQIDFHDRLEELEAAFATVLGARDASRPLANAFGEVQAAFNYKDSGFIEGDITNNGVLIVDPAAPGGFSIEHIIRPEVLESLERKVFERGVTARGVLEQNAATIQEFKDKYGSGWQDRFNQTYAEQREGRRRASARALRAGPTDELDPKAAAELPLSTRALLSVGDAVDSLAEAATSSFEKVLQVSQRVPVVGARIDAAQKAWVSGITRNPELAGHSEDVAHALMITGDVLTESGALMDRIADFVGRAPGVTRLEDAARTALLGTIKRPDELKERLVVPPSIGRTVALDTDALNAADPGMLLQALEQFNNAPQLLAQNREQSDKEQMARNLRMAKAQQEGKAPSVGDIAGTMWYQTWSGAVDLFGALIDRPQDIPLVLGAEAVSDMTVMKLRAVRSNMFTGLNRAIALRKASRVIADKHPGEVKRYLRAMNDRIASGMGDSAEAQRALRTAAAEAETVLKEVEAASAVTPQTSGRFAAAMSRALKHVDDLVPGGSIEALVRASPIHKVSTFGWRKLQQVVKAWNVDYAKHLTVAEQHGLASPVRRQLESKFDQLLETTTQDVDLLNLRARHQAAVDGGNRALAAELQDQIVKLNPDGMSPTSPSETAKKIFELNRVNRQVAQLQAQVDAVRGSAKKPLLDRLDELRSERSELFDEIRPEDLLDGIDQVQLQLWQDTGKLGYGPLGRFKAGLDRTMARLRGEDPHVFEQTIGAAERLQDFFHTHAENYYLTKLHQAARKERIGMVYRRAEALSDIVRRENVAQKVHAESKAVDPNLSAEDRRLMTVHARQLDAVIDEANARRARLKNEQRAMLNNPADRPWVLREDSALREWFDDRDLAQIVQANPEWFDFVDTDAWFETVADLSSPAQRQKQQMVRDARRMRREAREVRKQIDEKAARGRREVVKAGPKEETAVAAPEADVGEIQQPLIVGLELKEARLRAQASDLIRRARELPKAARRLSLSDSARFELNQLFTIPSTDNKLAQAVRQLEALRDRNAAALALEFGGDPAMSALVPIHMKQQHLNTAVKAQRWNMAAETLQMERLGAELNKLSPEERKLARLRRAAPATDDWRAWELEKANPDGLSQVDSNVENYLRHEAEEQARLLEAGHRAGIIGDGEYQRFKRGGYDPAIYGLHRFPDVVDSVQIARMKQGARGLGGPAGKGAIDGDELRFRRDLTRHRVFVREADGFATDRLFTTRRQAENFVRREFGERALREGKTGAGDPVTIADPIGMDNAERLFFRKENLLERRLDRFRQFQRDLSIHRFLEGVAETGGMVLSPEEFLDMQVRLNRSQTYFNSMYVQLPSTRNFGTFAGHYVHRRALKAMNDAAYGFDQLTSWMRGVQELFEQQQSAARRMFTRVGKVWQGVNDTAKVSLILLSPRTWIGNMTFNIMSNEFTGGHVLRAANFPNFRRALDEVLTEGTTPNPDGRFESATKLGILNGSVFGNTGQGQALRQAAIRAWGLDNIDDIRSNLAKANRLREEMAGQQRAGQVNTERLNQINLAIAALETALKERELGGLRKFAREVWGTWLGGTTPLGEPRSRFGQRLRQAYGAIDDVWRYATWLNLLDEGLGETEAADRVKQFMQNYGDLPQSVTDLKNSPFGSLVPAFPYELFRLSKNYIAQRPLKFMALASMVPAINSFSAMMAGVPLESMFAQMRASGHRNTADVIEGMTTKIMIFDPVTHRLASEVDFAQTVLPLGNAVSRFGPIAQASDRHFGKDTLTHNVARTAARGLQSFVLNNPGFNALATVIWGNDPVTGKQLVDPETATPSDLARAGMRAFGRSMIPPITPYVGRMATDLREAGEAPLHPLTGRRLGASQEGTVLTRETLALPTRGRISDMYAQLFGFERRGATEIVNDEGLLIALSFQAQVGRKGRQYGRGLPVFGADRERKRLAYQLQTGTEEEQAEARAQLMELGVRMKEDTDTLSGVARTATETELARYMQSATKIGGLANYMHNLDLTEKVAVVVEAERIGVGQESIQEWVLLASTQAPIPLNKPGRPKVPRDPGLVMQSMRALEEHLKDPRAGVAAHQMYDWLINVYERSFKSEQRRTAREVKLEQARQKGLIR